MALYEKGDKKVIRAWMMYDWANSVYNLVITTAIFPIFYEAVTNDSGVKKMVNGHEQVFVNFLGFEVINTTLINYVSAFGFLLVAFLSPLLSGMADFVGRKKMFLRFFAYMGSLSCMALYFFDVHNIHWGLLFYLTALIGFWGSLVFYNAYLPEIAHKKDHDKISAGGFAMGYIGSVLLLALCLVLVQGHEMFNISEGFATKLSFLLTGVWWFGFSHILFVRLKESKEKYKASRKVLLNGFKELRKVLGELKENKVLKRYLRAFFVYSMGVQTVMLVAVYFAAKEIEWAEGEKTLGLIISILIIQLIAIVGAIGMSKLSAKIGNIKTLQVVVLMWAGLAFWAYFIVTPIQFYITAAMVGLVMGGIQSMSRSTYSKFIPDTKDTSSYFSFYDVTEKIGIVIGMAMFALLEDLTGSMRNSILVITAFFVVGFFLLAMVPKDAEREK